MLFGDYQIHATRTERDAINLARLAEQSARGVVDRVDQRLRFLRWVERGSGGRADWPALIADPDLVDSKNVEIAVVDASGLVIASSLTSHLEKLIDVNDRPEFFAQRNSAADNLFVGAAVDGGSGGERVLPISRKRFDAHGRFAGVFVYSLPASDFDEEFTNLDVAPGGSLALVGDDGLIRAGVGDYAQRVGRSLASNSRSDRVYTAAPVVDQGFAASRRVGAYPLSAIAQLPAVGTDSVWRLRGALVVSSALAATLATLLAMLRAARRRRGAERELILLSRQDELTGLSNRRSLSDALDELYVEEDGDFALHFVDLDRFKSVNDSFGHPVGDEVLKQAAERLANLVAKDDLVARLGGDEFAILQYVSSFETEAPALARRVNRAMAQPFRTARSLVSIGATVGVARGRGDGENTVELLQAADLALHAAKADGRGGARLFRRELTEAARSRVRIGEGLRRALEAREFELDYQPVVSLKRGAIVGYEGLLRGARGRARRR